MRSDPDNESHELSSAEIELGAADFANPDIAGYANRCSVVEVDTYFVELAFWELRGKKITPVFRTLLGIDDVVIAFWPSTKKFHEELRKSFVEIPSLAQDKTPEEFDGVPVVASSSVLIFRHGFDALLDFHYLTARSVVEAKGKVGEERPTAKDLLVLPIARVQCGVGLVVSFTQKFADRIEHYNQVVRSVKPFTSVKI